MKTKQVTGRTGTVKGAKSGLLHRLDWKRSLAMSAVLVTHTLVFGVMLLPAAPIAATALPPPEAVWIEFDKAPPPPPPPPPETPVRIVPIVQPITATPPPIAPPIAPPPVLVATTSAPSEDLGSLIAPSIIDKPATVGGGSVGESLLLVLRSPAPPYPVDIMRKGIAGTVEFSVLVGIDGTAQEIRLMKSSGNRKLDQSTLKHIKRSWRFKAPEVDGQAVPGWGRGKVTFTIEG